MNDLSPTKRWVMRAAFVLIALLNLFFHLLPLETLPRRWAGPDMLLAFACAWSFRRAEYVPPLLLAAMFLLTDLLLQRPPGLWALLALLGCENLKLRAINLRASPFASEWLSVLIVLVSIAFANQLILAIMLVPTPPLGLVLSQLLMTVLVYPLVVLITHTAFGVRKALPGDLDANGMRV
jgi:rod shape-determining protein MreD